jgi:hypothetical protein
MPKKCEDESCSKYAGFGLASEKVKRWCSTHGKAHGAVSLQTQKACEDCNEKKAHYGLLPDKVRRWCGVCGKTHGAVLIGAKMCEECGEKQANFGAPEDRKRRWCAPCGRLHGGTWIQPLSDSAKKKRKCEGEGCGGQKDASYGMPGDRKKRWCGPCGKPLGAVRLYVQRMCEKCGEKQASYGTCILSTISLFSNGEHTRPCET